MTRKESAFIKYLKSLQGGTLYEKEIMVRTERNPKWRLTNFMGSNELLHYLKHNPEEINNYKAKETV